MSWMKQEAHHARALVPPVCCSRITCRKCVQQLQFDKRCENQLAGTPLFSGVRSAALSCRFASAALERPDPRSLRRTFDDALHRQQ
jgi:hypothetical protein